MLFRSLRLTYDPNADKAYDGFDPASRLGRYARAGRFGRVIDQRWVRTAGSGADQFAYTYDRNSNRLTRSLSLKVAYDETYQYDPASPQGLRRAGGLNGRVRKIVIGYDGNSTSQHIYHNTNWQVLEIRRSLDGNVPAATAWKQYAWGVW